MSSLATLFDPPIDATPVELRARLRSLADLIARAPVPIAVAHDSECRFISANDALARLLGVPTRTNISLAPRPGEDPPYRIQRHGRDIPVDELPMQFAMAHRTRVANEIEILRADGALVHVQNDVEPLYDRLGAVCGCVSVCVDVTERKQVERVLREADRRKDEFLATLSHELRNPLAPIRNALELMRRTNRDPALADRALAIMERQVRQLVRLTDDLLDVSRITRDRLELRRERLDLRTAIRGALETIEPMSDAAGHIVQVDVPAEPIWVYGDPTRLAQAFANVLNNAVKYTDRGGRITVTASPHPNEALISFADTGIGIDPFYLPSIFDMFVQIEPGDSRAQGGLGIGLALTRRLVELHGGHIEAQSPGRGEGTTFIIRLPLVAPTRQQLGPQEVRHRTGATCRVLVAEDIPDAAEMLRLMVESMGHEVLVASDGVQAVELAERFEPQIALLDIGMPRMDGYEAARRIRTLGRRIVLVALTGWGQAQDQQRAYAAGFDYHVTKPAEPDSLESLIASAVDCR